MAPPQGELYGGQDPGALGPPVGLDLDFDFGRLDGAHRSFHETTHLPVGSPMCDTCQPFPPTLTRLGPDYDAVLPYRDGPLEVDRPLRLDRELCPRCGSDRTYAVDQEWACETCGHTWPAEAF